MDRIQDAPATDIAHAITWLPLARVGAAHKQRLGRLTNEIKDAVIKAKLDRVYIKRLFQIDNNAHWLTAKFVVDYRATFDDLTEKYAPVAPARGIWQMAAKQMCYLVFMMWSLRDLMQIVVREFEKMNHECAETIAVALLEIDECLDQLVTLLDQTDFPLAELQNYYEHSNIHKITVE